MSNQSANETSHVYDAIVVGSGMSGGWAAKELSEKGLKTLVLERGRNVEHQVDYPTATMDPWQTKYPRGKMPSEIMDSVYPKQKRTGYALTEYSKHFFVRDDENPYSETKRFDWIRGYHAGGRSLLWARQVYRWSDLDFEANAKDGVGVDWPIRYADLEPWYAYVERYIGVSGQAEGLPQLPDSVFQPAMEMNCVEKELKAKIAENYTDRMMTIGRVAHITEPTEEQLSLGRGSCQYRNRCRRGCPYGAYFSSNAVTLVAAQLSGNMTFKPYSAVSKILHDDTGTRATGVRVVNTETGEETEYFAKVIFLCASAINSAWLMLNSKSDRYPTGFGNDSDQVGRNLMDHHLGVGARAEAPGFEEFYYSGRRPNGIYVPRFRNLGDTESQRSDYLRGFGYQGGGSRPNWDRDVKGFGAERKNMMIQPGPWGVTLMGFGEILPNPENRMTLNEDLLDKDGLPTVTFNADIGANEHAMRKDMTASAAEMLETAGFKNVSEWDIGYSMGLGIHEMGSARMGRDPKTSVLNRNNQVHSCNNVYVTDGAAMTSSACVNPSLTYMAMTARAANHAVEALKKGEL